MRKPTTVIIDTNIILSYPNILNKIIAREVKALSSLKDTDVVIIDKVVEELDKFKGENSERGRNSREFSRILADLLETHLDILLDPKNSERRICLSDDFKHGDICLLLGEAPERNHYADDSIIDFAEKKDVRNCIILTNDNNLKERAIIHGIRTYGFSAVAEAQHQGNDLYSGMQILEVNPNLTETLKSEGFLSLEDLDLPDYKPQPNEYVLLRPTNTLARFSAKRGGLVPLISGSPKELSGVRAKNVGQRMAIDALLNDDVKLVSLVGKAGTGKTLLAIACGLAKVLEQGEKQVFTRMLVSRPIQPMGKDLGYLPGDVNEKLGPWMQPVFDNLDFLFMNKDTGYEQLIDEGVISVEALTYIRGRTIPQQYMIVDEAQNLTPHEIKTIITRAGEGTKIVLTGDCDQIDSPYLDSVSNGLAYVVNTLKDEGLVAHVTLTDGERSELSEMASRRL